MVQLLSSSALILTLDMAIIGVPLSSDSSGK